MVTVAPLVVGGPAGAVEGLLAGAAAAAGGEAAQAAEEEEEAEDDEDEDEPADPAVPGAALVGVAVAVLT